jgi:hypothetical protein
MRVVAVYRWARGATGAVVHADGAVEWRRARLSPGEDDRAVVAAFSRQLAGPRPSTRLHRTLMHLSSLRPHLPASLLV